jgi:SAM-dependent methyltransferase
MDMPEEVLEHYAEGFEANRLRRPRLEWLRTEELLRDRLPPAPASVLDVGGGPGRYSSWLAGLGYDVTLIDPVPLHVEQASAATSFTSMLGDARALEAETSSIDVVMLMGPLYHLTERSDRLLALAEARRVVRPGGLLVAAAVSRYASLLDGVGTGWLREDEFKTIVEQDLVDGQHRNPTRDSRFFTTAFFHLPEELEDELAEGGFPDAEVLGVEGPGWFLPDVPSRLGDPGHRDALLLAARLAEADPHLRAMSSHLLAFAAAPA